MMYLDFTAGDQNYKLRLTTRAVVTLEKQIGCNPLAIFGDGEDLPTITTMVSILHASLQAYEHGINMNDAFDIFDKWLEDGHAMTDFLSVLIELYRVSGLIGGKGQAEEKN